MPSQPMEPNNQTKQYIRSDSNSSRSSEYASVTHITKDGSMYIKTADYDGSVDDSAVQKITEKYDSLGKLRSSLEKLDLNEDEPPQYTNDQNADFYYLQKKNGSLQDLTRDNDSYHAHDELSDQDLLQVETFFRSHKTTVYVCPTITNLYVSSIEINTLSPSAKNPSPCSRTQSQWQLTHTGIPVLLLDSGETRSRTKRRIQVLLAEKGTGFLLWKDTIDNLTNYKAVDNNFHTMFLSIDHRKMIGLSFNDASAAREFYERIEVMTSDPANISLSGPNSKAAKKAAAKKKKKVEKVKLPKKTDISQPCCFQHVTKVDLGDKEQFVTLSTLTGSRNKKASGDHSGNSTIARNEQLHKYKSEPALTKNAI